MNTEVITSVILGLGLSSAAGFRIFIPALITSLGAHYGQIDLAANMQWMATWPAIITLSIATIAEVLAYYIPFIDNLLDTIATPAAALCGTLLMGSTIIDIDPLIKWPISIIAGGGMATAIQGGTSVIRAASSSTTGGMANPVVSTIEAVFAAVLSLLSIVLPIAAGLVILWLFYKIVKRIWAKQTT
jgi:hypothetical protein